MRHILFIFTAFLFMLFGSCKKESKNGTDSVLTGSHGTFENNAIKVNSDMRNYRLVVPGNLDLSKENGLIFAYHGLGIDSKDLMPVYTELNDMAADLNAIIVYPEAQNGSWGLNTTQTNKDLSFFTTLFSKIKSAYKIDPKKIHAIGMSNGAYFCHILAKNNSHVFSSIAAHSGMIGLEFALGINASTKYPVLLIHGKNDPIFDITIARNDLKKYKNENHPSKLIEVPDIGHEWASKININDSISAYFKQHY